MTFCARRGFSLLSMAVAPVIVGDSSRANLQLYELFFFFWSLHLWVPKLKTLLGPSCSEPSCSDERLKYPESSVDMLHKICHR